MLIPSNILIDGDYWPEGTPAERSQVYEGKVIALIHDSEGTMYCAFEMPDQSGLQLISLGSRFFKGFTPDLQMGGYVNETFEYQAARMREARARFEQPVATHIDEHVSLPLTKEEMIRVNKKIGEDIRQKVYGFRSAPKGK